MSETFEQAVDRQLSAMRKIMIERQRKYGPDNIRVSGIHGLIVRMADKLARIEHDHKNCGFKECDCRRLGYHDESALDAYIDLANYAGVIAPMLMEGSWAPPLAADVDFTAEYDALDKAWEQLDDNDEEWDLQAGDERDERMETLQMLDPPTDADLTSRSTATLQADTICGRCMVRLLKGQTWYWSKQRFQWVCSACHLVETNDTATTGVPEAPRVYQTTWSACPRCRGDAVKGECVCAT